MPRKRVNKRKPVARSKPELRMPQFNWRLPVNACLVAAMFAVAWYGTLWAMDRQINSVRVAGPFQRVAAVQVEAALSPYLDNGLLRGDLKDLQQAVQDLPWVEQASVRRSWPSTLVVTIREQRAAARWGEDGLLNQRGELFVDNATHIPAELPRLTGPDGSERRVAERFFALDARLAQRGYTAVSLAADERGAWELGLSNGMRVRFGAQEVEARIERFFAALDQALGAVTDEVDYIDMRYTNGFAIGWKPGSKTRLAELREKSPHG